MNIKRLLYFPHSGVVLAIILGFGLATLFRKSCGNKSCLEFAAPDLNELQKNTYNIDGSCYKFVPKHTKCERNKNKEVLTFA